MGSDDFCSTGLELGLGLSSSSDDNHCKPVIKSQSPPQNREPSLNLTLSGETHDDHHHFLMFRSDDHIIKARVNDHHKSADDHHLHRQDSGGASSFSNNLISAKRERVDYPCNKVSDEEDDEKYGLSNVRKKLRLTKAQSALLEESFKLHSTLNPRQKQELARELKLRPRQVEVWFQNRRARTKLKQTEVDCELLKKCCENLRQENLRLHKEIQRLKSLTHRHYKQCPSCERPLYSRHFTNNNNHPSAAC